MGPETRSQKRAEVDKMATKQQELEKAIRLRSHVKSKLLRLQNTLLQAKDITHPQLQVFEQNATSIYDDYCKFHTSIIGLITDDAMEEHEKEYTDFEELNNTALTKICELKLSMETEEEKITSPPQVIFQQKPLKIPIPTFDGTYTAWPKFKAIFQDLMANSGDSEAVKLYHLDKALTGEAAGILDAKVINEGNYEHAWQILTERYENKRIIIDTHIRGLFSLKKMTSETHHELRTLVQEASRHVESLKYLGQELLGISDLMIVHLLVAALDKSTRKAWEGTQNKRELPNYHQTIEFLKSRCRILENCETAFPVTTNSNLKPQQTSQVKNIPQKSHAASSIIPQSCEFCGGSHRNHQCTELNTLTSTQKMERIRAAGVCFNCLQKGHRVRECPSTMNCRKCQRRHRTIIHEEGALQRTTSFNLTQPAETADRLPFVPATSTQKTNRVTNPVSSTCSSNLVQSCKTVLLQTALVQVFDYKNQPHLCRVLLDSGSQVNFVSEELSNRLGVRTTPANVPISGINALRTLAREKQTNHASIEAVEEMMQQFWKIEEVPDVPKLAKEEMACEEHFLSTYNRDETGRFVVRLPFKDTLQQLNSCRALAQKRFLMLERRLARHPDLQNQYKEFIHEYEELGHCHEIHEAQDPPQQRAYYLPHHAVLRPSSSSTKCRVVFDASAKAAPSEFSLNDVLQVGPVVQNDLHFIVLRFRRNKIAFSGDVSKMYRQIRHAEEDQRFLRIFWRDHPSQPLRVLELSTVTYGTAAAPFLATRCLVQLVAEDGNAFPVASRIVLEETYMDDVLSGADSVDEAIEAQRELKQLLAQGGFPIRKWCSNSQRFLEQIPEEDREKKVKLEEKGVNETIKVLGVCWDPNADIFFISYHPELSSTEQQLTKRIMYSEIARLFDPLGLVSPVVVLAKLLTQRLWKQKIGWDDPVDEATRKEWQDLQKSLSQLHRIAIPRCVTFDGVVACEIHGFSDASSYAYGACIYLRSLFPDGSAKLQLLTSKSKLAPLHDLSIPRKELCAALLLTRLLKRVLPALNMKLREIVLWCDSTIVLAWIGKPLNQLQLFVRNRIAVIQEETSGCKWEYVRSQFNPADVISRGQLPEALEVNSLWWNGPEMLQRVDYETSSLPPLPDDELPELKDVVSSVVVSIEPLTFFNKFSHFRKIQRIMGYVLRFIENCRKPAPLRELRRHLTVKELRLSTEAVIRVIQHVHLADEIRRVMENQPCKKLANLRPIYVDGLLRVGGRLDKSLLPFENRHPIILPNKDPVVRLLIRQMHAEHLHIGQTGLLNVLRQRYWLIHARSTIRAVTKNCVRCFRLNPTNTNQLMGDLPASRVVPSPPFAITGLDYAGPIMIKQGSRRPVITKAYVCVFVCMTTKAVHLEAVSDLSTDAFLASLKRFIGRRGMVQQLNSDNATNFRGANHELKSLFEQFHNQQSVDAIQEFCRSKEIEWHFIPPDAPEFGGLWEAAVKSAKTHLKRIVGNVKLNFEELSTVLTEIEAVLNSRPLFAVSNDPADPMVITPAHYLIGRPLTALAEPSLEDVRATRLSRWQHLQLMREHFWRAWSRDYLNTLQPRKKNLRAMPNIRKGLVVLLHDRNQPPLNWKMGRVTSVYPGKDGLVRAVDVFTGGATYRRAVNKISVLPIEDNCS
ncbi:uncharacterized protein LOC125761836 [Anopheles funestus]|uniref:uncharacterized protein LOC125761836 n=1 Tax=Anopheles funestus TaxID=62324 RepID=UPI0020C6CC4D|nr:uncharacterized protein LOC125761836 [Anopheles funestus]